ncbi:hypothetical protein EV714DRAFT_277885 [Schizophyllum commune]
MARTPTPPPVSPKRPSPSPRTPIRPAPTPMTPFTTRASLTPPSLPSPHLVTTEHIPVEMVQYQIAGGRVYLAVHNLFEVSFCLVGAQKDGGWFTIHLEFLIGIGGYATKCCGKTTDGDCNQRPPNGGCYEGEHTTDIKRARFRADATNYDDNLISCIGANAASWLLTRPAVRHRLLPGTVVSTLILTLARSLPAPTFLDERLMRRQTRQRPRHGFAAPRATTSADPAAKPSAVAAGERVDDHGSRHATSSLLWAMPDNARTDDDACATQRRLPVWGTGGIRRRIDLAARIEHDFSMLSRRHSPAASLRINGGRGVMSECDQRPGHDAAGSHR